MAKCTSCQKRIPEGDEFCEDCGGGFLEYMDRGDMDKDSDASDDTERGFDTLPIILLMVLLAVMAITKILGMW